VSELKCWRDTDLFCPYCDEQQPCPFGGIVCDGDSCEEKCVGCGKAFDWEAETKTYFTTFKKEQG